MYTTNIIIEGSRAVRGAQFPTWWGRLKPRSPYPRVGTDRAGTIRPRISGEMTHIGTFFSQRWVSSFIIMGDIFVVTTNLVLGGGLLNSEKKQYRLWAVMVHVVSNFLACLGVCTQMGGLHPLERLISTWGNTSVRSVTPINRGTFGRPGITWWCGSCRHPTTLLLSADARIKKVTCILVFRQQMSSLEYLLHWRAGRHLLHPNENPGHSHCSVSELL